MNSKLRSSTALFVVPTVVFLDQISKFIAQSYFKVSCNSGLVFGIGFGEFGSLLVPLLTVSIISYSLYREKDKGNKLALALILGGGLSNLVDRIFTGCVRDFIQIWSFPGFNMADSFITAGVLAILYFLIFNKRNKYHEV